MANLRPFLLCVDDDPGDREALREYIDILGWNAVFAANGTDGYAHAQVKRYDLIVVDQNMPDLTGLGLVKCIRARSGPNAETPIFLNSRSLTPSITADAANLQVEAIEDKPLLLSRFKATSMRLLREAPGQAAARSNRSL